MNNLHITLYDDLVIVLFNDHGHIYKLSLLKPRSKVQPITMDDLQPEYQNWINSCILNYLENKRYE